MLGRGFAGTLAPFVRSRPKRATKAGFRKGRATSVSSRRPTKSVEPISRKPWIGINITAAKETVRISPATVIARSALAPAPRIAASAGRPPQHPRFD
jgi:hypothetical protein